jgi:cytochrome b
MPGPKAALGTPIWDLPLRLFHWLLVLLVASQIVTAFVGGNAMQFHALGGYAILTLILFRILWGLVGGTHARFGDFVRGPGTVIAYAKSLGSGRLEAHRGHNPLGGWSVVAMLASLLLQASTGLFANDDVMLEGPLVKHVSGTVSSVATGIHEVNAFVLLILVSIHIAAVLFYLFGKNENLIVPMITGRKRDASETPARYGSPTLAAILVGGCAAAVYFLIRI